MAMVDCEPLINNILEKAYCFDQLQQYWVAANKSEASRSLHKAS